MSELSTSARKRRHQALPLLSFVAVGLATIQACMPVDGAVEEPGEQATSSGSVTVIAHRGASGYLPEHTLPAYTLAYAMGADFLEPDVVVTRDGALIALHDIHLESTTDVEDVFPDRARSDGRWYAADFDLAEVRELRVHERTGADGKPAFPERYRGRDANFAVPTLREVLELLRELNRQTGCAVGVYPETKAPSFHDEESLDLEARLLALLAEFGYESRDDPAIVQSFETGNLIEIRERLGSDLRLVQLIGGSGEQDDLVTADGLDRIARYADGIGPSKSRIEDASGRAVEGGSLVALAHERGLVVHPYTFRADDVAPSYDSFAAEVRRFVEHYGVDGFFTDHTDRALAALPGHQPGFPRCDG